MAAVSAAAIALALGACGGPMQPEELARSVLQAGARGYVLKARDAEHLIQTVRLVAGGNNAQRRMLVSVDRHAQITSVAVKPVVT